MLATCARLRQSKLEIHNKEEHNMVKTTQSTSQWEIIKPQVNAEAEFFEILNDFGDPLEILQEAISNAIDAHAAKIKIGFDVEAIEGRKKLIITIEDNGDGMTYDVIGKDFGGLGYSPSRD